MGAKSEETVEPVVGEFFVKNEVDHGLLSSILEKLQNPPVGDGQYGQILSDLFYFMNIHFRREEEVMKRAGYPELDHHKAQHEAIAQKVRNVLGDASLFVRPSMGSELKEYLVGWIDRHTKGPDQEFEDWLTENGFAPTPVDAGRSIRPEARVGP